jgi:hypothetical protein
VVDKNKKFTIIKTNINKIMSIFDFSQLSPEVKDLLVGKLRQEFNYCKTCGSKLGVDCGDAEPDYNDSYCSVGCYESRHLNYESEKI